MQEMSVTYSQLDREARKAANLAQCAAERAAFLAAVPVPVWYWYGILPYRWYRTGTSTAVGRKCEFLISCYIVDTT